MECYQSDKRTIEAFSGHYYYWSRDQYTGQKSEVLLEYMIQFCSDLKKEMEEKSVLTSFTNFFVNSFCLKIVFLSFHLAKNEPSKKSLKETDFLFNASKAVFFECLNVVSACASERQYYCKCNLFSGGKD